MDAEKLPVTEIPKPLRKQVSRVLLGAARALTALVRSSEADLLAVQPHAARSLIAGDVAFFVKTSVPPGMDVRTPMPRPSASPPWTHRRPFASDGERFESGRS